MPDQDSEIMASLGRLEAHVSGLEKRMDEMCNFKDVFNRVCQEFKDYKAQRSDLPERLSTCEKGIDALEGEATYVRPKVEFLWEWRWKAAGVATFLVVLQAVVSFIVLMNDHIGITYTLGR